MENTCYAAIDIGSNAARLLIKKQNPKDSQKKFTKLLLLRVPLRLGFDVFKSQEISEKKAKKLCRLMKAYRQMMLIYDVDVYRACATSAMRDAKNGTEIIELIKKETNINIEIIEGKEEAKLIYGNHLECMQDRKGNFIYVDVGGGSTEINFISNGELIFTKSYNIGTVRSLSGTVEKDTITKLEADLDKLATQYQEINIIGSGGNINKLYKMAENKDPQNQRVSVAEIQKLYNKLSSLTVAQRIEEFNLNEDRADVIVPAAQIFLLVASRTNATFIHVPVMGLADGIIDALYEEELKKRN
ncbi:MAG: hypothetical protein SO069_04210 [Succinivibrio sp.]|nr:hypothetical protein [Succinivibrio sp.]